MGPNKKAWKYCVSNVHTELKPQRIQSNLSRALPKLAYTATAGQFRVLIMTKLIYFPWSQKLREHMKSLPNVLPFKTM